MLTADTGYQDEYSGQIEIIFAHFALRSFAFIYDPIEICRRRRWGSWKLHD
jgi:hypothetical protein